DHVVASQSKGLDKRCVGDCRGSAPYSDGAAVDEDVPGGVAAHDNVVVEIITKNGQSALAGVKQRRHRWEDAVSELLEGRQEPARFGFVMRLAEPLLQRSFQP